jgi:hypothetical protein
MCQNGENIVGRAFDDRRELHAAIESALSHMAQNGARDSPFACIRFSPSTCQLP